MRNFQFNRQSLARLCGAIGALALFGALLLYLAQQTINGAVFAIALIGVALLSLWLTLLPDDLRGLFTRRRTIYGGNSLIMVVLVTGIVLVGYTIATSSNVVADLTAYRYYSLRPDIEALIQSLDHPLMITVFYTTAQLDQQETDQPILNLFRDGSHGLISLNVVDPDLQPTVARAFGYQSGAHAFVTDVTADGKPDTSPGHIVSPTNDYVGEQQIADAILLLQARGKFKVLFAIGDGEISTDSASGGIATQIRGGLEKVGISTGTIDLNKNDIPQDTTALVLLAPKTDLTAAETQRIETYMGNGGQMLIMASPLTHQYLNEPSPPLDYQFLQDSSPMTQYLWESWGVHAQNDIVYDPSSNADSPYHVLTAKAANHSITSQNQAGTTPLQAILYLPRSWEVEPADKAPTNVQITPLFQTSDQAFGATDVWQVQVNPDSYQKSSKDLPGPLILAAAAENNVNHSRLVVIGDYEWATDQVVEQFGNALLWSNMMNWLTQYQEKTSVTPIESQLPLITSTETLNVVAVVTLLALPGAVLVLGGFVWWSRARH